MLSELEALVILTTIPYLGAVKIRALIKKFGSALAALDADPALIAKMAEFGERIAQGWQRWRKEDGWKRNLELAEKEQVEIVPYTSSAYPKRLLEIADHPVLLYVKGTLLPTDQHCIAVVGTRQASIYGKEMAEKISQELAGAGLTVVSGLARGIDTSAHAGALRRGRTIAVIGSGLADIYPQENIALAKTISERGALISEFPMDTPPDRQNFPQRNRIVSGMTMATLVVEAPVKSGAMITVEKALSYKRRVFALPGRSDVEDFRGNHLLIKSGQAKLVENAKDILENFEDLFSLTEELPPRTKSFSRGLSSEETEFLKKLPSHEVSIEDLMQLTKIPVMNMNTMIMSLLLKKAIKEYPGKIYKKIVME